ncbi:MAG TPA: hypothetical protein VG455_06745 [Acidimicrobiales bacterium]|nr:hypothetical protein [Acidimicrobiales bacterium]
MSASVAIVAGAIGNKAGNGGASWTRLSWARGLADLGFTVHFVEQLSPTAPARAEAYFGQVMGAFGMEDGSTLLRADGTTAAGLAVGELGDLASEAVLLLNISGHLALPEVVDRVRTRVFVDLDPGFTQIWEATGNGAANLAGHDHWFTVGENIGKGDCLVPTSGRPWRPIRQPVVLADWPVVAPAPSDPFRFTTVASWRGPYGPVEHGGRTFGVKAHQFRRFLELPRRAPGAYELALEIHPADGKDRAALEEHGWWLVGTDRAADPAAFRGYVRGSGAEFSVAQSVYVDTASGWFSDRTVRYLASGRPALVQDTGFSRNYPTGEGLLRFSTLDEAVAGAASVVDDYERHCRSARALAEEWFSAEWVLGRLCEEVGVAP